MKVLKEAEKYLSYIQDAYKFAVLVDYHIYNLYE